MNNGGNGFTLLPDLYIIQACKAYVIAHFSLLIIHFMKNHRKVFLCGDIFLPVSYYDKLFEYAVVL